MMSPQCQRGAVNTFQRAGTIQRMQPTTGPMAIGMEHRSNRLLETVLVQASNFGQTQCRSVGAAAILNRPPEPTIANQHIACRTGAGWIGENGIGWMWPPRAKQSVRDEYA
jgi:hypothetical protein